MGINASSSPNTLPQIPLLTVPPLRMHAHRVLKKRERIEVVRPLPTESEVGSRVGTSKLPLEDTSDSQEDVPTTKGQLCKKDENNSQIKSSKVKRQKSQSSSCQSNSFCPPTNEVSANGSPGDVSQNEQSSTQQHAAARHTGLKYGIEHCF